MHQLELLLPDCHSRITNIQRFTGHISDLDALKAPVLKFSDFWLPARQNNYSQFLFGFGNEV
jgi:hypothetical protein